LTIGNCTAWPGEAPDDQPTFGVSFGIKDHPNVTGFDPPERRVLLKRLALSERIGFKRL